MPTTRKPPRTCLVTALVLLSWIFGRRRRLSGSGGSNGRLPSSDRMVSAAVTPQSVPMIEVRVDS